MTIHKRWALPLALAASAGVGAALALLSRDKRRHVARAQHKENLRAWEGEGGSLATPAPSHEGPDSHDSFSRQP
jgi:hypothetical protein